MMAACCSTGCVMATTLPSASALCSSKLLLSGNKCTEAVVLSRSFLMQNTLVSWGAQDDARRLAEADHRRVGGQQPHSQQGLEQRAVDCVYDLPLGRPLSRELADAAPCSYAPQRKQSCTVWATHTRQGQHVEGGTSTLLAVEGPLAQRAGVHAPERAARGTRSACSAGKAGSCARRAATPGACRAGGMSRARGSPWRQHLWQPLAAAREAHLLRSAILGLELVGKNRGAQRVPWTCSSSAWCFSVRSSGRGMSLHDVLPELAHAGPELLAMVQPAPAASNSRTAESQRSAALPAPGSFAAMWKACTAALHCASFTLEL